VDGQHRELRSVLAVGLSQGVGDVGVDRPWRYEQLACAGQRLAQTDSPPTPRPGQSMALVHAASLLGGLGDFGRSPAPIPLAQRALLKVRRRAGIDAPTRAGRPTALLLRRDAVAENVLRAHRGARAAEDGIADNVGSVRVLGANVPSHVGRVEDPPAAMRAASGDAIQRSFAERLLEGGVALNPGPAER
jgi:hypothetical protein